LHAGIQLLERKEAWGMTLTEFLTYTTRTLLAFVAFFALIYLLRKRDRPRLDIALMLASLGIPVLVPLLPDELSQARWVSTLNGMSVASQPFLALRLVEHFRPVSKPVVGLTLLGLLATWGVIIGYPPPLPQHLTAAVAGYLVIVESYVAFVFSLGLLNARGSTKWRLAFASLGSAFLAATFIIIVIIVEWPSVLATIRTPVTFLPVLAGVAYYLAFAPPGWLRRAWQLPEVHKFLDSVRAMPPDQRSTASAAELCKTATAVGGGLASAVALWDNDQKKLAVQSSDAKALMSETLSADSGALARAHANRLSLVATEPADLTPDGLRFLSHAGAKSLLIVPVATPRHSFGLLLVLYRYTPLFPEDDLSLLGLLADQYAMALDNEALVARQAEEQALRLRAEILVSEINHRVKNSLQVATSLLSLQADNLKDPGGQVILRESEGRLRAMAAVHSRLHLQNGKALIDFDSHLRETLPPVARALGDPSRISLQIDSSRVFLNSETAVPCALIVNELVTNALKHAFPKGRKGAITVNLVEHENGCFLLTVSDDGIGFPQGLDFREAPSLGLRIVNGLTQQVQGTIEMEQNCGTIFRIKFTMLRAKA
jgi:two-component sensor histidine kinase